jgi:hypothetical protein
VGTRPAQGTVCPHNKVFWAGLGVPVPGTGLKWSGTGTPSHMTGVPGVPILWAGRACGTVEARPGQSLDEDEYLLIGQVEFPVFALFLMLSRKQALISEVVH